MQATTITPTSPDGWTSRAATSLTFFGTGTAIDNPIPDPIVKGSNIVELETTLDNIASPIGIVQQPDGADRLYVFDQTGVVTLIDNGTPLGTPFLDASSDVVTLSAGFDERGFIGFVFHPNFPTDPRIFTYISQEASGVPDFPVPLAAAENNHAVISEWTLDTGDSNIIDPSSKRDLIRIGDPQFNHNGGALRFGTDGYLYIALGDGGNRDDEGDGHVTGGNAQDITNPFGSILRIDIDDNAGNALSSNGEYRIPSDNPYVSVSGLDEIWANGLRNPFSFSFDQGTGTMYIADVGQGELEEVNIGAMGANYGWPYKEGTYFFDQAGSNPGFPTAIPVSPAPTATLTDPIAEYDHDEGISIIGGFVYRGTAFPALVGKYITGDFSTGFGSPSGRLFALDLGTFEFEELQIGNDDRSLDFFLKNFGQDLDGEIYICASTTLGPTGTTGLVQKLVPPTLGVENWFLY